MAGKKARGFRAKTRAKITASRIKPTITRLMRTFEVGQAVQVVINGSIHAGMPFRRFHGLTGNVTRMQGRSAIVQIKQGAQDCELIVAPIHLKEVQQTPAAEAVKK